MPKKEFERITLVDSIWSLSNDIFHTFDLLFQQISHCFRSFGVGDQTWGLVLGAISPELWPQLSGDGFLFYRSVSLSLQHLVYSRLASNTITPGFYMPGKHFVNWALTLEQPSFPFETRCHCITLTGLGLLCSLCEPQIQNSASFQGLERITGMSLLCMATFYFLFKRKERDWG